MTNAGRFRSAFLPLMTLCLSLAASVNVARAAPVIDFNIDAIHASLSPSISYGGGASSLLGSQISVDSIAGIDTPLFANQSFAILDGVLNFETGASIGSVPGLGWQFAGGGSLSIEGSVDTNGDDIGDFTGTLFTASFADNVFVNWFSNGFRVAVSALEGGQLNSDLADLFGISTVLPEGSLNLAFSTDTSVGVGDAFSSTRVFSGDVAAVPEAGTALMAGLFAVGSAAGFWYRRRQAQADVRG